MGDANEPAASLPGVVALPRGASDLLPPACRRRRAVTARLLGTFEAWGYEPVSTPAIEYFDVLARGLTEHDRRGCVRFIAAGSGELVTLRADVTPQIARLLAQRWGGELPVDVVHRLSYAAEVLRQPTRERSQTEIHQVGVELVGDGDPAADAELVALADASLRAAGLSAYRLDLAHMRVARGLLGALGLPVEGEREAKARLARKDREGLRATLARFDGPAVLQRAAVALCDLYGPPGPVLERAAQALADAGVDEALDELRAVVEHLERWGDGVVERLTLDLGEARGFDYYSGLRLRGWARGVRLPVVRGGRYDGLPRRFGVPQPATGFAVDLAVVEAALDAQGHAVPEAEPPPAHLVAVAPGAGTPDVRARAQAAAREAQAAGLRAWVQPEVTLERAQQVADGARAREMTFLDGRTGARWSRGPEGWAPMKETT